MTDPSASECAAPTGGPSCPVCGVVAEGPPAFEADVPILLNVLVADEPSARAAERARLSLRECTRCGFCWNEAFVHVPYDHRYLVDPTLSGRFGAHLDEVADRIAALREAGRSLAVVDVGAGQGNFLAHLARRHPDVFRVAHGFDPAHRGGEVALPDGFAVTASYFEADAALALGFEPDVVVTRHVVEHVPDPAAFLASIHRALGGARAFTLVVETPNVEHTLARGLLHDFCYEHCSLFTRRALEHALARAGYERCVVDDKTFGGEYLLAVARFEPSATPRSEHASSRSPRFATDDERERLRTLGSCFVPAHRVRLERARARGPVVLWGGAGKGALFAHFVDPDRRLIDAVVDIHPAKQGHHLPGAGHRVIGIEGAKALDPRTVLVANPTYEDEVRAQCHAARIDADVWCVGVGPGARG